MQHVNIVKFEDLVESNNNIYFFMEYCSGGTLEKYLSKDKKLTEQEAVPFFK
jgi:serine/threonine protein kinase